MHFALISLVVFTSVVAGAPVLTVSEEIEQIFQNLTSEAQDDYFRITFNQTQTLAEQDEKYDQWAEKYGFKQQWDVYVAKWHARRDRITEITNAVIEKLPSAYKMVSEVTSTRNQTIQEVRDALDQLEEPYHLELKMIFFLTKVLVQNEDTLMNGRTIEVGNEVVEQFRRMRDFKKNGSLRALLVPGPLV